MEYDDVTFSYDASEAPILDGISFEVDPGETVALVCPTGAGKSTVLQPLPRMYEVDGGRIEIDGDDVRDLSLASLHGPVGYVSQENYLCGGTVQKNVTSGTSDTDEENRARMWKPVSFYPL